MGDLDDLERSEGSVAPVAIPNRLASYAVFKRGADRYDVLLAIVVFALASSPFAAVRPVIIALALVFEMWTSNAPDLAFRIGSGVSVVAIVVATTAQLANGSAPVVVYTVTVMLLCLAIIASTARGLTQRIRDTGRLLEGPLSIYILTGLLFASLFALIGEVRSGGFFAQPVSVDPTSYVYYSFTTLTSVGFGDFTANNDPGRMYSVFEALFGQIYLVTVVAAVVTRRTPKMGAGSGDA